MEPLNLSGLNLPEKEEKILQAAIKVFSEKGFSASTTSEIAKNAGIAEGTIFRYFKTKKDILRGILIRILNILSSKVVMEGVESIFKESGDKDLRTILKELIYDRLKLVDTFFPMARIVITEALFHDDVREVIYQNVVVKALETFTLFHSKMLERGMLRNDIEPLDMLRSILGNLAALIAQKKLFGDKFTTDNLDKEIDKMLDILLYGIAPINKACAV